MTDSTCNWKLEKEVKFHSWSSEQRINVELGTFFIKLHSEKVLPFEYIRKAIFEVKLP